MLLMTVMILYIFEGGIIHFEGVNAATLKSDVNSKNVFLSICKPDYLVT